MADVPNPVFLTYVQIGRLAAVLRVDFDPNQPEYEILEKLADAAEELLTEAIIRERL